MRVPSRRHASIVGAIAAIVGCMGFATARLSQVEFRPKAVGTENYLWFVSQAQYDGARLAESFARVAAGEAVEPEHAPAARLAVLLSRLDLFFQGPPRQALQQSGAVPELEAVTRLLESFEPQLHAPLSREDALRLRASAAHAAQRLRNISNRLMTDDRDRLIEASIQHRRMLTEGVTLVLVTFVSTLVLVLYLLRGIRERQMAERLLQQEQQFSDLVVNLSHQGIAILDERFRCLLWNPGMESLLSVNAADVIGMPIAEVVPLFGRTSVAAALTSALTDDHETVEEEFLFPDDHAGCIEVSCHHLSMADRELVIAFVRDVTEQWQKRRQAEQQNVHLERKVKQRTAALRQAESRLLAAIRTAPDGFAAFDTHGNLLLANERIRSIGPLARRYRDDMSLAAFLSCFADCEGADDRLLTAGQLFEPIELELRLQAESWAHLSVARADQGTVFVRLSDVTPYKTAALALQSALDRERQTTNAYRSFVSMISHQFRTPLAIIDSSAQRLIRRGMQATEDEVEARIAKIRAAITRLTRLVESVLNAARIDAGQIEFKPRPCNLLELVSDICDRQRELSPMATVRLNAPAHPITVLCDIILIEQVVANLLSNALKYSSNTSDVEVRITVEEDRVCCSVRDWGVGIPADELPRIFDRFYRASTATGIAGTGIGLDVARQIMLMHGGDIRAESRQGEGSTFTFTLPTATVAEAPQAA